MVGLFYTFYMLLLKILSRENNKNHIYHLHANWNFPLPSDTCMELSTPLCLSSSEFEDVVFEEDWHFLFTVIGTLQLSKYLTERERHHRWKQGLQMTNQDECKIKACLICSVLFLLYCFVQLSL